MVLSIMLMEHSPGYLWSSAFSNNIVPSNIVHIGANTFRNDYIHSVNYTK